MAGILIAAIAGGRLLFWYKPWRAEEIVGLLVATALGSLFVARGWERRSNRILLSVAFFVLATGSLSAYAIQYRDALRRDLPALTGPSGALDAPRIRQPNGGADGDLLSHFTTRQGAAQAMRESMVKGRSDGESEHLEASADSVLSSSYQLADYPPVVLPVDLSWTEDPFDDRTWVFTLHKMEYLKPLVDAYQASGDLRYLRRAEELILDWIHDNSGYLFTPISSLSWHDHATAIRLTYWLYFWEPWIRSELANTFKSELVLKSMFAHAARLADPDFYTPHHNHGVDQARALLAFALTFPEAVEADNWILLAQRRLGEELAFAVSDAGIHLEHSPAYQLNGMSQWQAISTMLTTWRVESDLEQQLPGVLQRMGEYVASIVQPNGRLVPIGDTAPLTIDDPVYQSLLRSLSAPPAEAIALAEWDTIGSRPNAATAFLQEGYAIIRDFDGGRLAFDQSIYLFFTAGAHRERGHRQFDDLSFVLSYGGLELLTDPGVYSYKVDDGRRYVLSTAAHNTVTVDGLSSRGWDTTLDFFDSTPDYTALSASHRNYEGLEHRRTLIHVRPDLILLVDEIGSTAPTDSSELLHDFAQRFHTSPAIRVDLADSRTALFFDSAHSESPAVMRISQIDSTGVSARVVEGQTDPMLGWQSRVWGVLEPAPTTTFARRDTKAVFTTAIELSVGPQGGVESTGDPWRHFSAVVGPDSVFVSWSGRSPGRATIDRLGQAVRVSTE